MPRTLHMLNLAYLSLWYTAGRDYGLHEGEWKMTGGAVAVVQVLLHQLRMVALEPVPHQFLQLRC